MAKKKDSAEKKEKGKSRSASDQVKKGFLDILWGNVLSSNFFSRNIVTVLGVIGLFMLYITFKYECQTRMETIAKLESQLSIIKSESIREQSTYKSRTRESTMQARIDSIGLGLKVQEQPPYILEYEN